ncbi:MAG: TetR/AcrR family transcriptional regulator [Verrucomicrobiota bacterium]
MSRPPTDTEPKLYDCALTLFATKGYAATSVREIIETVGLTKPVLYYYCKNKLDLFEKLISRVHNDAFEGLERLAIGAGDPVEKLRQIIRGTFAFCAADWRVPRLMYAASFGPVVPEIDDLMKSLGDRRYALIRNIVVAGITQKQFRAMDPDVIALSFCSLMDHPTNILTRDDSEAAILTPELADGLFDVFLNGSAS